MKHINWKDISYLQHGNDKQKQSYTILKETKTFEILSEYNPILVGTIPIGIDTEHSDLDIVCAVTDFKKFHALLSNEFDKYTSFKINFNKEKSILTCNFIVNGIEIEIYGSIMETEKTNGYRHMVIEERILHIGGENIKKEIIQLKKAGLKTEPAFGQILNLKGNPYDALLALEGFSDEEISFLLK